MSLSKQTRNKINNAIRNAHYIGGPAFHCGSSAGSYINSMEHRKHTPETRTKIKLSAMRRFVKETEIK